MKKIASLILTIVFFIIGIFTIVDIFQSAWYVTTLETFTAMSAGLLFGKIVFLILILFGLRFSLKCWRTSKP